MLLPIASTRHGFTLVEIILAIMLFAIISVLSIPVFERLQSKNDLRVAVTTVVSTLRRAQLLSRAQYHDSGWSVYLEPHAITLFNGNDYLNRNTQWDEPNELPPTVGMQGPVAVSFEQLSGVPFATATLFVTTSYADATTITINEMGTVSYEAL